MARLDGSPAPSLLDRLRAVLADRRAAQQATPDAWPRTTTGKV